MVRKTVHRTENNNLLLQPAMLETRLQTPNDGTEDGAAPYAGDAGIALVAGKAGILHFFAGSTSDGCKHDDGRILHATPPTTRDCFTNHLPYPELAHYHETSAIFRDCLHHCLPGCHPKCSPLVECMRRVDPTLYRRDSLGQSGCQPHCQTENIDSLLPNRDRIHER